MLFNNSKRIAEALEYQNKLLESLLELMDCGKHEAKMEAKKSVEHIMKSVLTNPIVQSNPKMAELLSSFFPKIGD